MDQKNKETQAKKAYIKPSITRVELVAEEAVLAVCKTTGGVRSTCRILPTCAASTNGS